MRRFFLILIVLLILATLIGCGSSGRSNNNSNAPKGSIAITIVWPNVLSAKNINPSTLSIEVYLLIIMPYLHRHVSIIRILLQLSVMSPAVKLRFRLKNSTQITGLGMCWAGSETTIYVQPNQINQASLTLADNFFFRSILFINTTWPRLYCSYS